MFWELYLLFTVALIFIHLGNKYFFTLDLGRLNLMTWKRLLTKDPGDGGTMAGEGGGGGTEKFFFEFLDELDN